MELDKQIIRDFFSLSLFTDEDAERYTGEFIDWFDMSIVLDDARRELVANNLSLFLRVYMLGLYANRIKVMEIKKLVMELP